MTRRKRQFGIEPLPVVCYRLADVLTPEQTKIVRPYMRETFTETWTATYVMRWGAGFLARETLRAAARLPGGDDWQVEAALYARAVALECVPVLGPERTRMRR